VGETGADDSDLSFSIVPTVFIEGSAGVLAFVAAIGFPAARTEPALRTAIFVLGGFILFSLSLHVLYREVIGPASPISLRDHVGTVIATSALILGLLVVFGSQSLTTTAKVGTISLVVDILAGLSLLDVIVQGGGQDAGLRGAALALTNYVLVWALAFGLLCIGMSVVYR
jgi:hypothetical protein